MTMVTCWAVQTPQLSLSQRHGHLHRPIFSCSSTGRADLPSKLSAAVFGGWRARVSADPQFPFKVLAPTASTSPTVVLFSAMSFVYKGLLFSAVGFAAGLVGTALSNGLMALRKDMDPKKAPPMMLNAMTWAAHMGLSSNLRYHAVTGIEFLLETTLSPLEFKVSVLLLRLLNHVLGGITFVLLARFTGAQKLSEQGC